MIELIVLDASAMRFNSHVDASDEARKIVTRFV